MNIIFKLQDLFILTTKIISSICETMAESFIQQKLSCLLYEIENPKEPEPTDEEIDRMIRELERKKKRKEKDFEM